ncbi:hypothetical protein GUJ93_ZPchr0002g23225 [Zizania palustris]|uniref:Uncharacterized protein n=1 Tax=Zizania palustris TaxID=103762 RepID=A0A8J5SGB0_ZIZPA|nr:hypothetical protein GUJ93_ZPchr0002g23225 [Zizania palustris]
MEGLIPFVFRVIKKRRKRPGGCSYDRLHSSGGERRDRESSAGGGAYQSQSCRFPVRSPANDEVEFSRYDGDRWRASREGLAGEVSSPAGRNGRGLSRSLRFSSMRVLACVSGA